MSLGAILIIILILALLGGFSGLGGGPFYGTVAAAASGSCCSSSSCLSCSGASSQARPVVADRSQSRERPQCRRAPDCDAGKPACDPALCKTFVWSLRSTPPPWKQEERVPPLVLLQGPLRFTVAGFCLMGEGTGLHQASRKGGCFLRSLRSGCDIERKPDPDARLLHVRYVAADEERVRRAVFA